MGDRGRTAGPWRVDERGDIVSGPYNVAILYACKAKDRTLMAAAPMLLEALEDAFKVMPAPLDDCDMSPSAVRYRTARHALALAGSEVERG